MDLSHTLLHFLSFFNELQQSTAFVNPNIVLSNDFSSLSSSNNSNNLNGLNRVHYLIQKYQLGFIKIDLPNYDKIHHENQLKLQSGLEMQVKIQRFLDHAKEQRFEIERSEYHRISQENQLLKNEVQKLKQSLKFKDRN